MFTFTFSTITLLLLSIVSAQKPAPALYDDFSVTIEADMHERNSTVRLVEWHSFSKQVFRFEFLYNGTQRVEIFDYKAGNRHELIIKENTPFNCTTKPINTTRTFGHNQNFSELLMFGGAYEETYEGMDHVRNMDVEAWSHRFQGKFERFGDVEVDFVQKAYFTAPHWKVDGKLYNPPLPVRVTVNGRRNDTTFDHTYEMVDFVPGNPPEWLATYLFGDCALQKELHSGSVTPNNAPTATDDDNDEEDTINGQVPSGIVALIFFLTLFGGIAIGALAMYCFNKRRAVVNA